MFFCKDLFRSLARHRRKGLIALAVSVGLSAMLFLFAGAVASYQGELDRLEEDYDLTLTFTNVAGTSTRNLIIYDDRLQAIEESGLAEPGFYRATSFFSDGTEDDAAFLGNWRVQTVEVFTNDSPFEEVGEDAVTYFDGYDGDSFFQGEEAVCLLEEGKFQRMGLSPGDSITVVLYTSRQGQVFRGEETTLAVAGTYRELPQAYAGANMVCSYWTMRRELKAMKLNLWPSQASMAIPDPDNLNPLKEQLKELGINPVDRTLNSFAEYGRTAVINDSLYIASAEPTLRSLGLLQALYPGVLAAVALIALLASYLLIQSRRQEIALQRSLGVGRGRIFFLFFGESAVPALVGAGASLVLCGLLLGLPFSSLLLPALGFLCAFLLGSAVAVLLLLGGNVLAVLAAAE